MRSSARSRASSRTSSAAGARPTAQMDPRGVRALPGQPPLRRLRRLPPARTRRSRSRSAGAISARCRDLDPSGASPGPRRCPADLTKQKNEIAAAILKEIRERLGFLVNVGLDYLTLPRSAGTLSGGESQRIRLASQIGSGLTGVLYVLDEPSIGLHQRDNDRLLDSLKGLRDQGNTVIVVEHDEEAIREADHVIDIGPGAGVHGGEIIATGTAGRDRREPKRSITGRIPHRPRARSPCRRAAGGQRPDAVTDRRRLGQQPQGRRRRDSRSAPSPASPASRAAASRR